MYRDMTGKDMNEYFGDDIEHVKETDEKVFTLCPKNCGGPLIGHINETDEDYTKDSSQTHMVIDENR